MKKISTIIIALAVAIVCSASMNAARQSNVPVKGKVCGPDGEGLGFATVAIIKADSTVVTGTATNENGFYVMQAPEGNYYIKASMIGYKDCAANLTVSGPLTDVSEIRLEEDTQMLEGAVLTARQNLVEMKMDKIVMNVSQSAFAQGSTALDLIKKAPGVIIDKDGNIKLNGKSVSVWVDGRPSHLDGKSLEALLRSTAGSSIEKFELMPNPSSKYDAAGQGGIINIKTKKNALSGFNGSLGANAGGMYYKENNRFLWQEGLWANLNYRGKKTNTFLNVYEGIYNGDVDFGTVLETQQADKVFRQETSSYQATCYKNFNIKLGNDWFIDDKNIFGFIVTVPGSKNNMYNCGPTEFGAYSTQWIDGTRINRTDSKTVNNGKELQASGNLNYTHIFDEARSAELTANLDYYRTQSITDNNLYSRIFTTGVDGFASTSTCIDNRATIDIYSAKLDYQTVVWKNAMLEAGAKWATSMTDNNMTKTVTGLSSENNYTYREHVGAVYVSMAKPFGTKFTVKAGLRGEYTNSLGDWISDGTRTRKSYFSVFPTVYFSYTPSQKLMMNLSYSRRIQRPGYQSLDPSEVYTDAHTIIKGNPALTPQFSNSVHASLIFCQYFSLSLGYSHERDMFSQIPTYKENGDQVITFGNFGKCDMVYFNGNISAMPITKWWIWTLNVGGVYTNNNDGNGFVNDCFFFSGYNDFTFMLPKDWKIQVDGRVTTPITWGYYRLSTQWMCNLGVKKSFLNNRLTLSMDLDDIFRSSIQKLTVIGGDENVLLSKINQKFSSQMVKFGLSWNFGQAQRTRMRKVGTIDEASRIGGGSGIGK